MNKKWKIILICLLILPCVVFFGGCNCGGENPDPYENVTHEVSFYTGSEEYFNVPTQTVKHGELVVRPPKPIKTDCTFVGWYADITLTIPWKFDSDTVESSIKLYAKWNRIENIEIEPHKYAQLIFDRDAKAIKLRKDHLFNK